MLRFTQFSSSVASYVALQDAINTLSIFLILNTEYLHLSDTESSLPWVRKEWFRFRSANVKISNVIVLLIIEKDE